MQHPPQGPKQQRPDSSWSESMSDTCREVSRCQVSHTYPLGVDFQACCRSCSLLLSSAAKL